MSRPSATACSRSRGLQVADPRNPQRLAVDTLDLDIHAGEIVGIYGLMASGRTEFLEAIAGRLPAAAGTIGFLGVDLKKTTVRERIRRGVALVPRTASATGSSRPCRWDTT